MAAGVDTTDDVDADGLPRWMQHSKYGYHHAGDGQMQFAFSAMRHGLNVPEFDLWLSSLRDSVAKTELMQRRIAAFDACCRNDVPVMLRHLEFMKLRKYVIEREDFLLPLAKTGNKVREPFRGANKERKTLSQSQGAEWQSRADAKWSDRQHADKSAAEIARLIAEPNENPDTIRRKIKKAGIAGGRD